MDPGSDDYCYHYKEDVYLIQDCVNLSSLSSKCSNITKPTQNYIL